MVISSWHIGALLSSLGFFFDDMNWISIDLAAGLVVDIAITRKTPNSHYNDIDIEDHPSHTKVYHLTNPRSAHWQSMQSTVARTIAQFTSKTPEIVDPSTWIAKVRDSLETAMSDKAGTQKQGLDQALQMNPAAKLLDFYTETMLSRDTDTAGVKWVIGEDTLAASKRLRDLSSLQESWMEKWVSEWLGTFSK